MTIYKIYISLVQLFTELNKYDINNYQALFWFGRPYNTRNANIECYVKTCDHRSEFIDFLAHRLRTCLSSIGNSQIQVMKNC